MGDLGEELKELIRERFHSVPKFAEETGVPAQTIYTMCRNGVVGSSLNTVIPIAMKLGIDPHQLKQGRIVDMPRGNRGYIDVPLLGATAAGEPKEAIPFPDTFPIPATLHERYPDAFLLRIDGDSMDRLLPDGCYALVNPCPNVDFPGQPYAVEIDNETVVKLAYPLANGLRLMPSSADPTHEKIELDFRTTDPASVRIIGRVVWYTLPFDWRFTASQ